MLFKNLIESNGNTIEENNLTTKHRIPIGTLVEMNIPYSSQHGIRMFVYEHTRDFDGSPLYALYHDKDMDSLNYIKSQNEHEYRVMTSDGFSDDCLIVIKHLNNKT